VERRWPAGLRCGAAQHLQGLWPGTGTACSSGRARQSFAQRSCSWPDQEVFDGQLQMRAVRARQQLVLAAAWCPREGCHCPPPAPPRRPGGASAVARRWVAPGWRRRRSPQQASKTWPVRWPPSGSGQAVTGAGMVGASGESTVPCGRSARNSLRDGERSGARSWASPQGWRHTRAQTANDRASRQRFSTRLGTRPVSR